MSSPVLDATSAVGQGNNNDTCSTSITVGSLTNGILIIRCTHNSGTPQTPTVGGSTTGVTLLDSRLMGIDPNGCRIYYLLNPSAGTQTVQFQSTGATFVGVSAVSYSNVNQVTPWGTTSKGSNPAALSINVTVASAADDIVIDVLEWQPLGTITATVGAGQTQQANAATFIDGHAGSSELATGTSVNMSWSLSGSSNTGIVILAAALKGASGTVSGDLAAAGSATVSLVGNLRAGAALAAAGTGTMAPVGADAQPPVQRNYMSKSDTFENDWLKLIFNATPIANIADNAASSPLTNLFVALHTADPGEAGVQTTNETAYVGYARQSVARTSGGWTVTGASVSPAANIDFPVCTATPGSTITHASVGVAVSGGSKILYSGPLSPQIAIAVGVIPRMTTASTITED